VTRFKTQKALPTLGVIAAIASIVLAAPQAEEILRRMHTAGWQISFEGEQVTLMRRGDKEWKVRRRIMHQAPNLLRVEHLYPPWMKGELIVSDGRNRWHYFPGRKEVIKTPQHQPEGRWFYPRHREELARRAFRVVFHGEDQVAGRNAYVIELQCGHTGGMVRKFWVDTETFVKLKSVQTFPAMGTSEEVWFEKINFRPRFREGLFTFIPPKGVRVLEPPGPAQWRTYQSLAELSDNAPFPVKTPEFLPAGYRWESGAIQESHRGKVVWTRYTNGLDSISLFQREVKGEDERPRRGPRGAVVWRQDGYHFVLVGRLPYEIMLKIANSIR